MASILIQPKLKIGFVDTHDHIASFFKNILSARYDLEIDNDNPEFLLFGDDNFGNNNLKFSKQDCIKIFYTGENRRPENYDCHYAISFDHNFNNWHYRLPLFVIYMWALQNIHRTNYHYNYIFDPEIKDKTSFATFVVGNPGCKERNDFFKLLSNYKKVDAGGKLYKNVNIDIPTEADKINFLSSRKFNICFESMSYPGYVTEKILHAFYAGTIPIYWGNPLIEADFNSKAFINCHNYDSFEEVINKIIEIDNNEALYYDMISETAFNGGIAPSYILLDNFLNWFDAVVYTKRDYR
jgi:hypothetical protein